MWYLIIWLIGLVVGYFWGTFVEWRRWRNKIREMMDISEDRYDSTDS